MVDLFIKGGPVMWPILLCSVFALAAVFERSYVFHMANRDVDGLMEDVEIAVHKGDVSYAAELCRKTGGPVAAVMQAGLTAAEHSREEMQERMEAAAGVQLAHLERYLYVLSTIGNIAPLLGFLGTVWGMILAFEAIAAKGVMGDPSLVASGIAQALITTAGGLAVAVPTVTFHNYSNSRLDAFTVQMEQRAHSLVHLFAEKERSHALQASQPA